MKQSMLFRVAAIALLASVMPAFISDRPNAARGDERPPRTYYESLDLDTPEAAVRTFVDAFQRQDFPTVFLIFAANTQFRWVQLVNLLRYGELLQIEKWDQVKEDIPTFSQGIGHGEHSDALPSFLFDSLMLAAKKHSALLIDLSGEVTILGSQPAVTEIEGEQGAVDVRAAVDGIEGAVIFRMGQAPSGRWRVLQVIVPAGNEALRPWSVPSDENNKEGE